MDAIIQSLQKFFVHFHKHSKKWEEVCRRGDGPLKTLQHFSEQLETVQKADVDSFALGKFPGLKERLLCKIKCEVDMELKSLQEVLQELSFLNRELKNLQEGVNKSCSSFNLEEAEKEVLAGTSTRPSVYSLLEWVEDVWIYYYTLYMQITIALRCTDFESRSSVEILKSTFHEDKEVKKHINAVLAYTHYFVQES